MAGRSILTSQSLQRKSLQVLNGGGGILSRRSTSSSRKPIDLSRKFICTPSILCHDDDESSRKPSSFGVVKNRPHYGLSGDGARMRLHTQPYSLAKDSGQTLISSSFNNSSGLGIIGGFQQRRWKQRSAKIGKHKEVLEEIAHRPEHEAALERRQKKKDRQAAKKSKKGKKDKDEADSDDDEEDEKQTASSDEWDDDDVEDDETDDSEDATSLPDPVVVKGKMMAYVTKFQDSLKAMCGTEPSPELLEDIQVDAYGTMTPLKAVGQVVIVSPTLAQVSCFDPALAKNVQKSIQLALQLNPQLGDDGGGVVQVPIPRVSMETRQATAKLLQKRAETCRQRIRNVRRKHMNVVKQAKDGKIPGVSEDDAFSNSKELEKVTQDALKLLQDSVDRKLESILDAASK